MRAHWFIALGALLTMPACRSELTSPNGPAAALSPDMAVTAALTDSVLLVVAGDMHADSGLTAGTCGIRTKRAKATAAIAQRYPQALIVPMGDNAMHGTRFEFNQCYNQSWGVLKSRTYATIGNHEFDRDMTATAYYDYFNGVGADSGRAGRRGHGYYNLDYGGWRILVANSIQNRTVQTAWMARQLAASPKRCTMAIWHRPLFTSSAEPPNVQVDVGIRPWWQVLYSGGADVVLNGHAHNYERFAELRPDGVVDTARGIREFVVGTGGSGLYGFNAVPRSGSLKRIKAWGVLKLTLWPTRYKWEFIDTTGVVLDRGQDRCH
jgi:predicted phosphodiesterase